MAKLLQDLEQGRRDEARPIEKRLLVVQNSVRTYPESEQESPTSTVINETELKLVQFAHPRQESVRMWFALGKDYLFELNRLSLPSDPGKILRGPTACHEQDSSVFLTSGWVLESGLFEVLTVFDPLFLLVASMVRDRVVSHATGKTCFTSLSTSLDSTQLGLIHLQNCHLHRICDSKEVPGESEALYALKSDERLIQDWLQPKLDRICDELCCAPDSLCNQTRPHKSDSLVCDSTDDTRAIAASILSEYISDRLFRGLCEKNGLCADMVRKRFCEGSKSNKKRVLSEMTKSDDQNMVESSNSTNKRPKSEHDGPELENVSARDLELGIPQICLDQRSRLLDPSAERKKRVSEQQTRANKKLAQGSTKGMKSMLSYFAAPRK